MNKEHEAIGVLITDVQLHSTKGNNNQGFQRKIEKALKSGNEERIRIKIHYEPDTNPWFEYYVPSSIKGKKVEIIIPPEIPISLGNDIKEKIQAYINNPIR